ncbi:MAG TPA: porphobilinogen synthase [candidate division Zixibacteria bacterium]|nr:porphobilinogen synthase [candidate division Zixibacteria bacterium]HER00032.1 porphobilinogen synthase [candidate division Zixibacteria bacterium]
MAGALKDNSNIRPRRLRSAQLIRDLTAETRLNLPGMIQPYFVIPGKNKIEKIESMPGIERHTADRLVKQIEKDVKLGIKNVMLFGLSDKKDSRATMAYSKQNPVVKAIRKLRTEFANDVMISCDICLCAYTDHGHCGLIKDDYVDNDASLDALSRMAVVHAEAGADIVAPSDMMDFRVGAIREALDSRGFINTLIMAYTAKYASAYYGPFREAADSAPSFGDRKTYQMDYRNSREALKELWLDIDEGADIVMVKPALPYLDIISLFRQNTDLPVAAYNVSGEFSQAKLAVKAGLADEKALVLENLTAITRAGADIILTYHLRDLLKNRWFDE